jgi:hypothetical protein
MDKQQIKARFFGTHIGCKCTITGKEMVFELVGLDYDFGNIEAVCLYSNESRVEVHRVSLDDCKLVLRPLSSITDAEAVDVLTRATGLHIAAIERDDNKIVGVGMGRGGCNIISGGGNVAMWIKISPLPIGRFLETWNSQGGEPPEYMDYIAIDYLRSINICIPFMGLDPIAEGWAILDQKISANAPKNQKEEEN